MSSEALEVDKAGLDGVDRETERQPNIEALEGECVRARARARWSNSVPVPPRWREVRRHPMIGCSHSDIAPHLRRAPLNKKKTKHMARHGPARCKSRTSLIATRSQDVSTCLVEHV